MDYTIKYAAIEELSSWMKLVRLVAWNFPGLETEEALEEYKNTVIDCISRKSAICAVSGDMVVGVLLFSTEHNMLGCMAVHPDYRKRGIAKALTEEMISNLDRSRDIIVDTFREGDPKGIAPRALYLSLGFEPAELVEDFGYPSQRFVLLAR